MLFIPIGFIFFALFDQFNDGSNLNGSSYMTVFGLLFGAVVAIALGQLCHALADIATQLNQLRKTELK